MSAKQRPMARKIKGARPSGGKTPLSVAPEHYPALSALVCGYLHQDFVLEHKTAARAVAAFRTDANASERRAVREEWQRFAKATAGLAWPQVRAAFTALGAAWLPPSRSALQTAFAALADGKSSRA